MPGPHICEPSPQRTPFLFNAGVSKVGSRFGGKHGEAIFIGGQTYDQVKGTIENIRNVAKEEGRKQENIKVIMAVTIITAATDEEAEAKRQEYLQYTDFEGIYALFGGWTGIDLSVYPDDKDLRSVDSPAIQGIIKMWSSRVIGSEDVPWTKKRIAESLSIGGIAPMIIGGPKTVADELERWVDISGVDGFNLMHIINPGSFEDIIEYVLPELRRRGRFRNGVEKEGATAREVFIGTRRLPEDHYGSRFKWRAGEKIPKYQQEEITTTGENSV